MRSYGCYGSSLFAASDEVCRGRIAALLCQMYVMCFLFIGIVVVAKTLALLMLHQGDHFEKLLKGARCAGRMGKRSSKEAR
jgi:hypothetical protein